VDALTNLHTRRYVMDCLSIEFLRAKRYGTSFAVMMADLDHFKDVNDSFGHPGGDAVLRGVSALLLQGLRATDMAGRYGGDEIIAVFPHNAADGAEVAVERWRALVAGTKFGVSEERAATVTVSVGIAAFDENFESPDDLVAAADSALYLAKQNGGNRIEIHGG
jgi:diguanylate cyclase (GGDEF)-like protein